MSNDSIDQQSRDSAESDAAAVRRMLGVELDGRGRVRAKVIPSPSWAAVALRGKGSGGTGFAGPPPLAEYRKARRDPERLREAAGAKGKGGGGS